MITKLLSFKFFLLLIFLTYLLQPLNAMIRNCVISVNNEIDTVPESLYERRITKYENSWRRLMPRYQKIQFAGSMGLISIGPGWEYGHDHWETDLFLGFLPPFGDKKAKATFTIKQNYIPWEIFFKESRWSLEPLTCGLYMNSILDNRFWKKEPQRYPENYYKFSTKIRFHIFMGQRVTFYLNTNRSIHKSISLFYELSSCDLYIISAVTNKVLRPRDYLSLSFGLKLQMF